MIKLTHVLCTAVATSAVALAVPNVAQAASPAPSAQDVTYLKTAVVTDLYEIVSGGVALDNAKYPTTKAYAKRVVKDHAKALFDARKLAKAEGITLPTALPAAMKAQIAALDAKTGAAFDVAYLSGQVRGHFTAVAVGTKEIAKGTDPAVESYATSNAHVLRYHLWRSNLDLRYVRWAERVAQD